MPGWIKGVLIALAIILVVALSAPWWLGVAARPLAAKFGATFDRYERIGYGRFALHGLRYARGAITFDADRVESATPLPWGVSHARGGSSAIGISGWSLVIGR